MNPEIKAKWVAALRSGEYEQSSGVLKRRIGFCCLGVLCDLHSKKTGQKWDDVNTYMGYETHPPVDVYLWAGLDGNPEISIDGKVDMITDVNDRGVQFTRIADAIEAQL